MKRLVFLILGLFVAACEGGGGGSGGNTATVYVATPPIDSRCYDGTAYCNSSVYNQYYGWSSYPGVSYGYNYSQYFSQYGFCNCPIGSQPVYNPVNGLGCVRSEFIVPINSSYFYWNIYGNYDSYATSNPYMTGYYGGPETPTNYRQVSNVSGYPTGNSCNNNILQSCFLSQGNTCGSGYTCRATSVGSGIGVCTLN